MSLYYTLNMSSTMLFLLIFLLLWTDIVYGQIGVTTCTFATQALCAGNIPLSYCDVAAGKCNCANVAGYIDDGTGFACTFDCGALSAPTNGIVSTASGTTTGKVATYSCNNGYKLVGSSTRTCIQDAGWGGAAPTCTPQDCGSPAPTNGEFSGHNTSLGATTTLSCKTGYELSGATIVTCTANGWDGSANCTIRDCKSPAPYNGTADAPKGTTYGEVAIVSCNEGYTRSGSAFITCLANGTWSEQPTCNIVDCGSPTVIAGTTNNNETTFNSTVTITCYTGYNITGKSVTTCQSDGTWSSLPTCDPTDINECASSPCQNGGTCNDGINSYTCICADGYTGTTCATDIDECFPVPCVNGGTCIDGINDYSCNCVAGYSGKTCDTRNWPKICNENVDERGTVWPETLAGNTLFKSCPETFTGNVSRVCSSDAEWIVPKYTCLRSTVLNATAKVFGLSTQSTDVEIVGAVKQLLEAAKQATTSDVFSRATDAEVFELTTALNYVAELVPADSLAATNDFIDSASSLVDQQHLNSWKTLEYWDSFGADNVIGAVEKVAYKSTLIDHSIVTTNIAYKKQNTTIKDVSFPRESDGGWLEDSRSSIYVSFSSTLDSSEEVTSFGLIYKNLTGILRASGNADIGEGADIVNGPVVSLTLVSPPITPVTQVTVVIEHSVKTGYSMPRCSFWKFGKDNSRGSWSTDGCVVASSNATVTVCTCDHLTNFAVLMSPFVQVDMTSEILRVASIVGMCISLLFLLITLLTHCCLYRYLRSDRVTHLINFCTALFVSYVIFLTGIDKTESRDICIFITSVLHYIYLVVFFLMLVGGIDVCYSVTFIFSKPLRMRCLLLAAWVLPAVIVGISLGITETKGYGNSSFCWLSLEEGLIWAFVGPALTVIALNVLFLAITIYKLFQARTMKEKNKLDQIKTTVRALCVLVPVMGISWIVGIFYVHKELYWIQFVFAICNSLQGIFVFLFHCAFNTQVKNAMKAKARKYSSSKMTSELKLSQRNNSGPSSRTNLREPSNDDFPSQPVGQKRCLPHRHHKY